MRAILRRNEQSTSGDNAVINTQTVCFGLFLQSFLTCEKCGYTSCFENPNKYFIIPTMLRTAARRLSSLRRKRDLFLRPASSSTSADYELKFENVSLNNYVNNLAKECEELRESGVNSDRFHALNAIVTLLNERKTIVDNVANLHDLLHEDADVDLKKLAEDEKRMYEQKLANVDEDLRELLVFPAEEDDCDSIVLEVNAGVGGQEAMLFAAELFEMYRQFALSKNWQPQTADYLTTELGGLRHGSLLINGKSAFKYFKYEAGVHRVQRIPSTEKAGRIHTSTVSVLALPQPTDIQISLNSKDLKFETKRASGAGGQHVNTTDSAVRVVHVPTGMAVECQVDRSQVKNREFALQRLKAKLYQVQLEQQVAQTVALRKNQVRSNFRNEKIRTYNFSQDRVTDHRLQGASFHNLKGFLEGGEPLGSLMEKLHSQSSKELLLDILSECDK